MCHPQVEQITIAHVAVIYLSHITYYWLVPTKLNKVDQVALLPRGVSSNSSRSSPAIRLLTCAKVDRRAYNQLGIALIVKTKCGVVSLLRHTLNTDFTADHGFARG